MMVSADRGHRDGVVVVGAGHAGIQLAIHARQEGYEGRIRVVGDETSPPYQRPPLSKDFLAGRVSRESLAFRPASFFESKGIELVAGSAEAIDRDKKSVRLGGGALLRYEQLVLACGAANRPLGISGANLRGVMPLRTLADAESMRAALAGSTRIAVIGAGFIGLEFSSTAIRNGKSLDIVDVAPRLMVRSVSEQTAKAFEDEFRRLGAQLHLACGGVDEILGRSERVIGVRFGDGTVVPCDMVAYGVGAIPRKELAEDAGLAVNRGIVVDDHLRTSDPSIYAIGDCAEFPLEGLPCVLESVQNATDQARCVAAGLTGRPHGYRPVPWFWSDQVLRLQIAGLRQESDEHIAVGPDRQREFSILCFKRGKLIAVESVNRPSDHAAARKLLAASRYPSPGEASETAFDLKVWAARHQSEL